MNDIPSVVNIKTDLECVPNNVVRDASGNPIKLASGAFLTNGEERLDPGPQVAKNQVLATNLQVSKHVLVSLSNPDPPSGIGRLSRLQVKAVMTMIGKAASGFSYTVITPSNFVGKYQFNPEFLAALGYIKPEYFVLYGSEAVKKPDAWTNKDNVSSLEVFFKSPGVQENVMFALLQRNYITMENNSAIKSDDNLCTIAGMLCVAHILGPTAGTELNPGAKRWRETGGGQDVNGNYGATYFLLGRYAVDVLAAT